MSKKTKEDRRVWHIRVGNIDFHPTNDQLNKIRKAAVKVLGKGNAVMVSDSMIEINRLA